MSLEILSKDVLLKANSQKELLLEEFMVFSQEQSKESEIRIVNFKKKLDFKHEKDVEVQKDKILGSFKKNAARLILDKKNELVDKVYTEVLDEISNLKPNVRKDILKSFVKIADANFDYDKILCSRKDQTFLKELVKPNTKFKIEEIEGIVFYGFNDTQIFDMTFKSVLDDVFEENENGVQNILFN